MKCEYCQGAVPPHENQCPNCGAPVEAQSYITKATRPTAEDHPKTQDSSAPKHGVSPLDLSDGVYRKYKEDSSAPGKKRKSRALYILLALLFGWMGIHNLYAGYYIRAAVQIVIMLTGYGLLIVEIWALIEIFTVKTDSRGIPLE